MDRRNVKMQRAAIALIWIFCIQVLQAQVPYSDITAFGAEPGGVTVNTAAIQRAINSRVEDGGGIVYVPAGVFMTGTLFLKSNITLYLENGAVLLGSSNLEDYSIYENGTQLGMIFAQDVNDVVITGYGTIDGNGRSFVYADRVKDLPEEIKRTTRQGLAYLDTLKGIQDGPVVPFEHKRPYQTILFSKGENIRIENITIKDSPFWAVHIADCNGVTINGIRIRNSLLMANADGINCTSSRNIFISNCDIRGGDDALAFSGYSVHHELPGYRDIRHISENVVVSNCLLQSRSSGIRIGGIDQNDLRNYSFSNITIYDSNRGIGIFAHQDGSIENVSFSDISIETRLHTGDWWGNGEPIHISVIEGAIPENRLGTIQNVRFRNINAIGENGILMYGIEEGSISDITIEGLRLHLRNGNLQDEYGGNFDLRPTVEIGQNIFAHDIPGIFMKYVDGVQIRSTVISWEAGMHRFFRHGIWLEDFRDITFDQIRAAAPRSGEEVFYLKNGAGLSIRNSDFNAPHKLLYTKENYNGKIDQMNNRTRGSEAP